MFQAVFSQLIKDLKASWQKTAVLAVLLLVGLCFWIPPLLRSAWGGPVAEVAAEVPVAATPTEVVVGQKPTAGATKDQSWEQQVLAIRTAPHLRSAEPDAIKGDPFHMDYDQFSPPVLFEDVALVPAKPKPVAVAVPNGPATVPEGMVLNSTIVGFKRRAALINSRLYYEGKSLQFAGRTYTLSAVLPRKVVLSTDAGAFELQIAPNASEPNE